MQIKDAKLNEKVYFKSENGKKYKGKIIQVQRSQVLVRFEPDVVKKLNYLHSGDGLGKDDCYWFMTATEDHDENIVNLYKLRNKPLTYKQAFKILAGQK